MYTEYHFPIVTLKMMDTINCFISVPTSFQLLTIAEKSNEYLGTKHQVYWFAWGVALHKVPWPYLVGTSGGGRNIF